MQVVTGLLIAEVNVKTMTELGSGGVSLVIYRCTYRSVPGFTLQLLDFLFIRESHFLNEFPYVMSAINPRNFLQKCCVCQFKEQFVLSFYF